MKGKPIEGVARVFRERPGSNGGAAERSPLEHNFIVVIEIRPWGFPDVQAGRVANLHPRTLGECRGFLVEPHVVQSETRGLTSNPGGFNAAACENLRVIRNIIEDAGIGLNQTKR